VIHEIEGKLEEVSRRSMLVDAITEQVAKRVKTELPVLFSKTESLDNVIGTRVKNDVAGLVPPTLWSSTAQLTMPVHETDMKIPNLGHLADAIKGEMFKELLPVVDHKVNEEASSFRKGIQDLKGVLASSIQQIADRFHQESIHLNDMRARIEQLIQHQNSTINSGPNVSASDVKNYLDS
jgi:hypothetical protein